MIRSETAFMRRELAALQARNPRAELKHRWVPYERISASLKRAVITAEDARFAEHEGVDWEAIEKAYKDNVKRGRPARGGSTITQQLAKNLFLSPERSYVRKAQELVITYMIEAFWDKRRILEVYLNVVEWGEGVFGAEAAARQYFGVERGTVEAPSRPPGLAAYLPNPKRYGRSAFRSVSRRPHRSDPALHARRHRSLTPFGSTAFRAMARLQSAQPLNRVVPGGALSPPPLRRRASPCRAARSAREHT